MTSKERISGILKREPVDRIGINEHYWGDTYNKYTREGHIRGGETFESHFNLDILESWAFNLTLDIDFTPKTVAETDETITTLDGNGATLRRHKLHDATPEHIGFSITDGAGWKTVRERLLSGHERRINFEGYREAKARAAKDHRFFCWSGVNVFECMHPVSGHEHMLMGMLEEPEWIADMAACYADMSIELQQILFEREGLPDGIWYYEDMGFKNRPFMSPAMYRELIQPQHKKTIDFAHSLGLPVVMHSCGFVEPLLPGMVEAGIDCLQVIEIKAGMDLLRIHKNYGDRLSLMGGIDVRTLSTNDRSVIDRELESKIPFVKNGFGYVLHSDHSIPNTVEHDTLKYFFERGIELGTY